MPYYLCQNFITTTKRVDNILSMALVEKYDHS